MNRQRELPLGDPPRDRERIGCRTGALGGGLVWADERIVATDRDSMVGKPRGDLGWIAVRHLDREEVMRRTSCLGDDRPQGRAGESLGVVRGDLAATGQPAVEARQQRGAQDRRVQLVETAVEAELDMLVAGRLPVVAQRARPLRQLRVAVRRTPPSPIAPRFLVG